MTYPDKGDLKRVNAEVNLMPYLSDPERYKVPDFWSRADGLGDDCESFALAKLIRLHALGWPIAMLRLACCYVETGDYHAVLAVDVGEDEQVVLDNRYDHVVTLAELQRTGYRPDIIQREGGSRQWAKWEWQ